MRLFICVFVVYFCNVQCKLWSKGVVHYAINKKDYDPHSQDIIISTFSRIEKEICVKFFNTPYNYSLGIEDKILYISNPDKRKTCPPEQYDYNKGVIDMTIGYKCLKDYDISRIVLDMLRASIQDLGKPNSNDLLRKFQESASDSSPTLLSLSDRTFINAHYFEECGDLAQKPPDSRRSSGGTMEFTADNERFYKNKLWPLGIVMYGVEKQYASSQDLTVLQQAMTVIEMSSCIIFQQITHNNTPRPKNLLWIGDQGEDMPNLGFMVGNQSVSLEVMVRGAPGHTSHMLNMLLRVLGIPMMSNRYDRDHYVTVNWKNVAKTKEHYLERDPKDAWLRNKDGEGAAYDYDSATHAPVNYMCEDCALGQQTVQPLQDHLWQKTLTMGHRSDLSPGDVELLSLLYTAQCTKRVASRASR